MYQRFYVTTYMMCICLSIAYYARILYNIVLSLYTILYINIMYYLNIIYMYIRPKMRNLRTSKCNSSCAGPQARIKAKRGGQELGLPVTNLSQSQYVNYLNKHG